MTLERLIKEKDTRVEILEVENIRLKEQINEKINENLGLKRSGLYTSVSDEIKRDKERMVEALL